MKTRVEKTQQDNEPSVMTMQLQTQLSDDSGVHPSPAGARFSDDRANVAQMRSLQAVANDSLQVQQLAGVQQLIHGGAQANPGVQLMNHNAQTQPARVVQREPEATPVKPDKRPIYHITTLENFQQIVARGGLVPLNWIIEGTHGQKQDKRSTSRGLDSARGASKHETSDDHARSVHDISEQWKQSQGTELEPFWAKRFADFKLGRKRDFVYGTKGGDTLSSYKDVYEANKVPLESLVVLRWIQADEDYYPDLEDSGAIKSLESIPLDRLQVTQATGIGDGEAEVLQGLNWLPANNLEALVDAGLLPPPPRVAPQALEEEPLPSIDDLEGQIQQDAEDDDAWLQQLEEELALQELEDELEIWELEQSIALDNAEEDREIAELEKELGPEAVAEIERQVREELAGEIEESARIDQMVAAVLEEVAPLLEQAQSLEEQLQIAMAETGELIDQNNQVSDLLAQPVQREVIQCMYEYAEIDIAGILDDIRGDTDNEADAETISKLPSLAEVTNEQLNDVSKWVMLHPDTIGAQLALALGIGLNEFANELLKVIANPPENNLLQHEHIDDGEVDVESTTFKALIAEAVEIHAPALGKLIDEAQSRATISGKKLLVIVGEVHDDPYSRVMVTILVGAMTRLGGNRLYIESTPELVKQHVEPFSENEPNKNDESEAAHRQHFFHNIYKQGAPIIGVDVDKETAGEKVKESLGPKPESSEGETEWKAKYMEQTVNLRNKGIAEAVVADPKSGVMLVGLSHLPGLQSDPLIQSAYEIVTVAAALPEAAVTRDWIAYGRILSTNDALTKMQGVYQGGKQEPTPEVSAPDAYDVAEQMIIELNGEGI